LIEIKKVIVIFFIAMISIMGADNYTGRKFVAKGKNVKIIAHRGSSKRAPENTISAILLAAEDKADYAELDVQETKDGVVVVMHDKSFKRVSGVDKNVSEMGFRDIEKLNLQSIGLDKFKGEKIPTLDQVMKVSKGKIKLDIEIKNYGDDTQLVKKVVRSIENNNLVENCLVCSFDYNTIAKVKKLNPKIKTGYITTLNKGDKLNLEYADYYSIYYPKVNKTIVERLHENNKKVHVWTVNNVNDYKKLIEMGVDNIITDYPDKFKGI
jgi:glycerophosphoryl diester phosphodiesterase